MCQAMPVIWQNILPQVLPDGSHYIIRVRAALVVLRLVNPADHTLGVDQGRRRDWHHLCLSLHATVNALISNAKFVDHSCIPVGEHDGLQTVLLPAGSYLFRCVGGNGNNLYF